MLKAKKPIRFGDQTYLVGQVIPEEVINPTRVKDLITYGLIAETTEGSKQSGSQKTSTAGIKKERIIKKIYSPEKLSSLKKEELIKIAQENQIATDGLTVKELINAIKDSSDDIQNG